MRRSVARGAKKNDRARKNASFRCEILLVSGIREGNGPNCGPCTAEQSNWTERDIWQYIVQENIPVVPLYFAKERLVVERSGTLIPADDALHLKAGEVPVAMSVRFRTLGCAPCTGAVASCAKTLEEIAEETVTAKISERSTRIIDHGANTMEDKKREGYF